MELKLGDLVDNFNRSSKILYTHRSSNALYWLPKQITSYHWLFKMCAKRAAASVSTKERQKKFSGHMIKCLLTELGRAGRENIWLSVRTHGPRCARSVRPDLVRPSHSVNKYIIFVILACFCSVFTFFGYILFFLFTFPCLFTLLATYSHRYYPALSQ